MTAKQTQPSVQQQTAMYVMIGKQMASSYPWWAMLIAFLVGVAAGLAGAAGLTSFLSSLLYGDRPLDPATFAAG